MTLTYAEHRLVKKQMYCVCTANEFIQKVNYICQKIIFFWQQRTPLEKCLVELFVTEKKQSATWEEFLKLPNFEFSGFQTSFTQRALGVLNLVELGWYKIGRLLDVHLGPKIFGFG